ncbi:MAG: SBBP repeat-containing protein [Candidatus Heimdallarchaeota archaeon]|nr:MAG: SBBP repeat-containing protein [Candidatus Heimdallarchaeota archaeon]
MLIMKNINNNPRITGAIVAILLVFSSCLYLNLSFKGINNVTPSTSDDSSSLEALDEEYIDTDYIVPIETPILPFSGFIENLGQLKDRLLTHYFSTGGMTVGFAPSELRFVINSPETLSPVCFTLTFPGARKVSPSGFEKQAHYINYFYGNFHQTNVPTYKEVWYYDLYPGIDLRYYMSLEGLKYEFIVKPGADPDLITLETSPSTRFVVEHQTVSFQTPLHKNVLQDTQLYVFQQDGKAITAHFEARGSDQNRYGFSLSPYDDSQTLVIDPLMLSFSTFLGGGGYDYAYDVAVDTYNNTYIIGQTDSVAFPVIPSALNTSFNGGSSDLFITKLNPVGSSLIFSTYLGGSGEDSGFSIVVDTYNNTYFTGKTSSQDYPITPNAINDSFSGEYDIFITKLNGTGNKLVYSTYLGGDDDDSAREIMVDAFNNTYITGETESLDFPATSGAFDETYNGGTSDAYIAKVSAAGDNLVFSTYMGGEGNDYGYGIAIDAFNNTYITGETWSSNFPTFNAYDNSKWGDTDVFITKINATGEALIYSTFLGGNVVDYGYGIAVDSNNNTYITGKTLSSNFPIKNEYSTYSGNFDSFVTKLNAAGDDLEYSTYLGGSGEDSGHAIAVDSLNNAYVTGRTSSDDFDTTINAYNGTYSGSYDAFVTKIVAAGNDLAFSTYLGGSGEDSGHAIAVDTNYDTYVAGYTRSSDYPTYSAYNASFGGSFDGFVTKFTVDDTNPSITLISPTEGTINNSGMVINVTIKDVHLTNVIFNWDGDYNQTWNEGYLFRLPGGDGQHDLYIYAYDRAGNWATEMFSFVTDDTPPKILIVSPGPWIYPSITVDISGDASHYWYYIKDVDSVNQTWTMAETRTFTSNGTYTLYAYGNDSIGNIAWTSVRFTIDTSFALVVIESPINTTTPMNTTSVKLSGDAESYWYYISGFQNESQKQTYLPPDPVDYNLADGTYTLHAYGNNSVGNVTHVAVTFTIDTIPPVLTIISPTNSTFTTGSVTVDLFGDAEHYWYSIKSLFDNQSWTSATQHNLVNGTYILHVYGNDTAGNEAHKSVIFTIDTTRATVFIDSPLSITYTTNTVTVSLSGDALFYLYRIPGVIDADTVWTAPVTYTLGDGTYTVYAYGFKTMGKATYVNVSFTIDTTPPIVNIDSPQSTVYTTDTITIALSTLSNAEHYWYYIEGIDSENQTWSTTTTRSSLPDGTYTIHVYGNDTVGNVAYTNVTFIIEIPIPTSIPSGTSITLETSTTGTSTTSSEPGHFPNILTVLLFLITSVVFIQKRKKNKM